jgi:hypothetical protein
MAKKRKGLVQADILQTQVLGQEYDHWRKQNDKEDTAHNAHLFALHAMKNASPAIHGLSEREIIIRVHGKLPDNW